MAHEWMGLNATDTLTGFSGMITGHSDYITGCDQFLLQPPTQENGEYVEGRWFDEQRLQVKYEAKLELDNSNGNGACGCAPTK